MLIGSQLLGFSRGGCVLDTLSSGVPAAAYSLRRLTASYTGKAINVRRSSDNSAIDIGFTGNDLDVTTLLNFVGSSSGNVTQWYNQGTLGSAGDAFNVTAATQPLIVVSGALQTINGKPAIASRSMGFLLLPAGVGQTSGGSFTVNAVFSSIAGLSYGATLVCLGTHSTNDVYTSVQSVGKVNINVFSSSSYGGGATNSYTLANPAIYTAIVKSGSAAGYLNGSAGTTLSVSQTNSTTYGALFALSTSATTVSSNYGGLYASDIIIPLSALSNADRQIIEHNQESYYGISGV